MIDAAVVQRAATGEPLPEACLRAPPPAREALAWALKAACHDAWSSTPAQVPHLAAALATLARKAPTPLVAALAHWTAGLADIVHGRMDDALAALDAAQAALAALGRAADAAQTQVPKLIALAVLGRHDDALACAAAALAAFEAAGDGRSAGKVELNLASMLLRQDRFDDAAARYRRAAVRFARLGDVEHSVMADIGLATAQSWQFRFDEAALMLGRARMRADTHGLPVLAALARGALGQLELHRGRYREALRELEASSRALADGTSPQRHAEAERALADAYLTLNLWPEAQAILERVVATAGEVGDGFGRAHAEVDLATALAGQGRRADAMRALDAARAGFEALANPLGVALADLRRAALALDAGEAALALDAAEGAAPAFRDAGIVGWALDARRLAAAARLALGDAAGAAAALRALADEAARLGLGAALAASEALLGEALERQGDADAAAAAYRRATDQTDALRSTLAGDDLRTGFGVDKQAPYDALVRLEAAAVDIDPGALRRLWHAIERARSRALGLPRRAPRVGEAVAHDAAAAVLRTRLNWIYHQWHQALAGDDDPVRAADFERQALAAERELAEARRRTRLAVAGGRREEESRVDADTSLRELQRAMPPATALVEFHVDEARRVGACWRAVVVTADAVHVAGGGVAELDAALAQARFQIDAVRFAAAAPTGHGEQRLARARHRLHALYRLLVAPLEPLLRGCRALVLVPHRQLHYVPFAALHDGRQWLVERFELSLAPSAAWWRAACEAPAAPLDRALVVGHGPGLPQVGREVAAVAAAWGGGADVLEGATATVDAVCTRAPHADLVHLACHARFRADNPAFSSLVLADGALTMVDAAALAWRAGLVTLSACDTAVAQVAPGDEAVGLVRGFLLGGVPSVVASLWTADDGATADLMATFATGLRAGLAPAAALAAAQRALAAGGAHPATWAAFAVHGRG